MTHSRLRGPRADRGRPQVQGGDPDGQPGPLRRRRPADLRVDLPTAPSAPCARSTPGPTGPSGRRASKSSGPRKRRPCPPTLDWDLWIGPAPIAPVPSHLSSGHVAGVVGLRHRLAGRPGLPHPRRPVLGPEAEVPGQRRGLHFDLLARPVARRPSRRTRRIRARRSCATQFPAREGMPEVKLTWWDGGMMPPRPEELEEGRRMGDDDGGVLFVGDKGMLMCGCYGQQPAADPRVADEGVQAAGPDARPASPAARAATSRTGSARARAASRPARTSTTPARSPRWSSWATWPSASPIRQLLWDGEKMEVTNDTDANAYVRRQYREGWTL